MIGVAVAFLTTLIFCPVAERIAWRIGAIDVPRDWRRMHTKSIPRCGGLALFAGVAMGTLFLQREPTVLATALAGGVILLAVGVVDDAYSLPAWLKLTAQVWAALMTVLRLGIGNGIFTLGAVLWVIAMTNAHNFIDGLDGLFGGTAATEGLALAGLYAVAGDGALSVPCLVLAAVCGAFLTRNLPPAKLFAGDCGSGSIGFLLGVLSLPAFENGSWWLGTLAPLLIFAYPLTDLVTAVTRRILRGKSPFAADKAHLHHRICAIGVPKSLCVLVLCGLALSLGAVGVLLGDSAYAAVASAAAVIAVLLMTVIRRFLLHFFENS